MPLFRPGSVITLFNTPYKVCKSFRITSSCDECCFTGTNMCAGGVGRILKNNLSCQDLIGDKGYFQKIKNIKGGI